VSIVRLSVILDVLEKGLVMGNKSVHIETEGSTVPRANPKWLHAWFEGFLSEHEHLMGATIASIRGMDLLCFVPEAIEISKKLNQIAEDITNRRREAERVADFAAHEIRDGFPVIVSQAIVSSWALLENTHRSLVTQLLQNNPDYHKLDIVNKIKVRLGDFLDLSNEERVEHIVERIEQELAISLKNGIARFESVLEAVGSSGQIEEPVRRALIEFNSVRNVIVHRKGFADRRVLTSCPWLGLRLGEKLKLQFNHFLRYHKTALKYLMTIYLRVSASYTEVPKEHFTDVANWVIPELS
jgi:hypothetical protein